MYVFACVRACVFVCVCARLCLRAWVFVHVSGVFGWAWCVARERASSARLEHRGTKRIRCAPKPSKDLVNRPGARLTC
ncbi:hypothetical protein EVAR_93052_1 [Eumeta japonica]|uniref:Uncharacterized protein n=1 Tax=Eumeta variegata TaxID=151549 RepID=A0A4C1TI62_EUMVA|nr:hypothetical protein EVAR_93052_1 [Eumeta japonica]